MAPTQPRPIVNCIGEPKDLLSPTSPSQMIRDSPSHKMCVRTPMHDMQHAQDAANSELWIACVLTLALTFHSVMEGLAIGASGRNSWSVFAAVMAHKGLAAFGLSTRCVVEDQTVRPPFGHETGTCGETSAQHCKEEGREGMKT